MALSSKRKDRWVCDVCKIASFLDYDEACRHESTCKVKPQQNFTKKQQVLSAAPTRALSQLSSCTTEKRKREKKLSISNKGDRGGKNGASKRTTVTNSSNKMMCSVANRNSKSLSPIVTAQKQPAKKGCLIEKAASSSTDTTTKVPPIFSTTNAQKSTLSPAFSTVRDNFAEEPSTATLSLGRSAVSVVFPPSQPTHPHNATLPSPRRSSRIRTSVKAIYDEPQIILKNDAKRKKTTINLASKSTKTQMPATEQNKTQAPIFNSNQKKDKSNVTSKSDKTKKEGGRITIILHGQKCCFSCIHIQSEKVKGQ